MFGREESVIQKRREIVFIVIAGIFLGTLAILNILGISRLIDLSFTIFDVQIPFLVFIGVLPYPVTFLCTDLISEMYGKRRANTVVFVGFILNVWVLVLLWIGGRLPGDSSIDSQAFFEIRKMAFGATGASMLAYLVAQFIDVQIFHYIKEKTKGKHLWLRNNASTFISQFIDSVIVVSVTYFFVGFQFEEGVNVGMQLMVIILSGYVFKLIAAALDTLPFYVCVNVLSKYFKEE